jgi:hypothetical protein
MSWGSTSASAASTRCGTRSIILLTEDVANLIRGTTLGAKSLPGGRATTPIATHT